MPWTKPFQKHRVNRNRFSCFIFFLLVFCMFFIFFFPIHWKLCCCQSQMTFLFTCTSQFCNACALQIFNYIVVWKWVVYKMWKWAVLNVTSNTCVCSMCEPTNLREIKEWFFFLYFVIYIRFNLFHYSLYFTK